jgi:hypothetical protein
MICFFTSFASFAVNSEFNLPRRREGREEIHQLTFPDRTSFPLLVFVNDSTARNSTGTL